MKKLVTISRQYGSGGRTIGKLLADILHVPFYDKEIIDMAVEESGYSREVIEGAEMKAKSGFAYSLSSALSFTEGAGGINKDLSVNDRLFLAQYRVIQEIGASEEGVIIGRCADYVLKDKPGVTNVSSTLTWRTGSGGQSWNTARIRTAPRTRCWPWIRREPTITTIIQNTSTAT